MITEAATSDGRRGRAGATSARVAVALLIISFAVFGVAVYARMAAAPSFTRAGFWDTVRSELDPVLGLWVLAAVTIGLANALIAVAVVLLTRGVHEPDARRWARASVLAALFGLAASAVYIAGYLATVRFSAPSLGGEPLFWIAYVAGFIATLAVALALTFLAVAWRREGVIRSRVLVVVSIVVSVVAIALPPAVVGALGLAFGVVRLRSARYSLRPSALS